MLYGTERRAFELRASDDGGAVEGTVIPYGQLARIADFSERFLPGSITFGDVIANRQHIRSKPLARTGGGLTLTDSATELRARIELPATQDGKDVRELVKLGILRGLSAEFRTLKDAWEGTERTIHQAQLTGLAIVDVPAYLGAGIEAREAVEWLKAGQLRARSGGARLWPLL